MLEIKICQDEYDVKKNIPKIHSEVICAKTDDFKLSSLSMEIGKYWTLVPAGLINYLPRFIERVYVSTCFSLSALAFHVGEVLFLSTDWSVNPYDLKSLPIQVKTVGFFNPPSATRLALLPLSVEKIRFYCSLDASDKAVVEILRHRPRLKTIEFRNRVSTEVLEALPETIETVIFSSTHVDPENLKALCEKPNIGRIVLSGSQIPQADVLAAIPAHISILHCDNIHRRAAVDQNPPPWNSLPKTVRTLEISGHTGYDYFSNLSTTNIKKIRFLDKPSLEQNKNARLPNTLESIELPPGYLDGYNPVSPPGLSAHLRHLAGLPPLPQPIMPTFQPLPPTASHNHIAPVANSGSSTSSRVKIKREHNIKAERTIQASTSSRSASLQRDIQATPFNTNGSHSSSSPPAQLVLAASSSSSLSSCISFLPAPMSSHVTLNAEGLNRSQDQRIASRSNYASFFSANVGRNNPGASIPSAQASRSMLAAPRANLLATSSSSSSSNSSADTALSTRALTPGPATPDVKVVAEGKFLHFLATAADRHENRDLSPPTKRVKTEDEDTALSSPKQNL